MEVKNKLENVIWHIETNRLVLGDEKTLNHVLEALKNMVQEQENETKTLFEPMGKIPYITQNS
ncbi:hypothetical protein ACT7C6_23980 [Bacillus paranthracis]